MRRKSLSRRLNPNVMPPSLSLSPSSLLLISNSNLLINPLLNSPRLNLPLSSNSPLQTVEIRSNNNQSQIVETCSKISPSQTDVTPSGRSPRCSLEAHRTSTTHPSPILTRTSRRGLNISHRVERTRLVRCTLSACLVLRVQLQHQSMTRWKSWIVQSGVCRSILGLSSSNTQEEGWCRWPLRMRRGIS
ncbi:hypothetical protein BKA70DRAFT_1359593 [Coprinopsis sp. MPI-PUGE-AT-0042]|nr:hypothetical protein BKA70DRAFT_1359593 [Coprinopsis sp. MPI-PUGE-AT-0042]